MSDRMLELLNENDVLYGIICRDPSPIEIELIAQAGYHVVWVDMEHAPFDPSEVVRLCRTILHLGMAPLVRIVELTRTQVQILLDGGVHNLLLPDIRSARHAAEFARLAKYPPLGERGVSSTSGAYDYRLGSDVEKTLAEANTATHLMVQVESDEGLESLDAICAIDGIDMVTVGPADWSIGLGLFGPEKGPIMDEKTDAVITKAHAAGKVTAMTTSDPKAAERYVRMGVRMLFVGVDLNLKRAAFTDAIEGLRSGAAKRTG